MPQPRWIETFSKTIICFEQEAAALTAAPMIDLDSPAAQLNYALKDRTKQYLSLLDAVTVSVAAVVQSSANYTLQRLGGIIRFATAPANALVANPAAAPTGNTTATTGGTFPAATHPITYTYITAAGETQASPAASQVTTGSTSTITTGAAAALPTGATGVNWYIDGLFVGTAAVVTGLTITAPAAVGSAVPPSANTASTVTITAKYLPQYTLQGGRNVGSTAQRQEIDTTSNGDNDMSGAPGRPKRGGAFQFIPGAKLVNAAAKSVTFKNMMEATATLGARMAIVSINDTTDTLQPRDAHYGFLGTTDMQRNLGQAIEQPITWFMARIDDSPSYSYIDYIA